MSGQGRPGANFDLSILQGQESSRHDALVELFGEYLFWLRGSAINASRRYVESEEARSSLGQIRASYFNGVAEMSEDDRRAALLLAQETLDGFIERFVWCMGDEGVDARLGGHLAYRYRVEMEIVDVETGDVVDQETINRGGRFFGKYWGRWLNRFGKLHSDDRNT